MADTKHPLHERVVEVLREGCVGGHLPHADELASEVLHVVEQHGAEGELPPGELRAEVHATARPGQDTTDVRLALGANLGKLLKQMQAGELLHPEKGYSVATSSGPPEPAPNAYRQRYHMPGLVCEGCGQPWPCAYERSYPGHLAEESDEDNVVDEAPSDAMPPPVRIHIEIEGWRP